MGLAHYHPMNAHFAFYATGYAWRSVVTTGLVLAWDVRNDTAAERRTLALDVEDESQLLALLRYAHRLPEDDQRLRRSLRESDPGAAFDRLRKQYPPRHELHHWRHQGKVAPPLRALVSLLFESNASGSARPVPALHRPAGSSPR